MEKQRTASARYRVQSSQFFSFEKCRPVLYVGRCFDEEYLSIFRETERTRDILQKKERLD